MLQPGQRLGVAVSGGADSICLLHVLLELHLPVTFSIVHVNHGLRGEESDGDEAFVLHTATLLNLPVHCRTVNLSAIDTNLEQAGRIARSQLYSDLVQSGKLDLVATGHTLSDQAETVLYRLFRGSGTSGLAGIWPVSGILIRPLLDVSRQEVLLHLRSRGLAWREDSSNESARFARNRIRHSFLPEAQKFNPALQEVLAGTSALARDEEAFWTEHISRLQLGLFRKKAGAVLLPTAPLFELSRAEARRLLRAAVLITKGDLRSIDFRHVEHLLALAEQQQGHGRLQLPGLDIFRSFNWLRFAKPREGSREDFNYSFPVLLSDEISLPEENGRIRLDPEARAPTNVTVASIAIPEQAYTKGEYWLHPGLALKPLTLRNWYPGDLIDLGSGIEKVKTLFQRHKVPIWERQGWPLLECEGNIIWARQFGVAVDARAVPGSGAVRLTDTLF